MAEEKNDQPREERVQDSPQAPELQAEYDRIKGKHKILKIVTVVLSSLLVIVAATAFLIYRKISQTIAPLQEAFQGFQQQTPYQPENRTIPAMGPSVLSSTSMPASSLGMFSGSLQSSQAESFNPEQGQKLMSAINKYADRPIVKEFLADLKKNPDMAKAFEASKGGNPLQVISMVQHAKGMNSLVAKYAMRPEFLKVLMEVMNDPEMKPFLQGMPGGMGGLSGAPGSLPGAAVSVPTNQPQAVSIPTNQDGDGGVTLDPAAISGQPKAAPAKPAKKVPLPVDTE